MTTKRFIDTSNMQEEILELLKKEFLAKQFFGEKIEVKLDLKNIIEERMLTENIQEPTIYITVTAWQKILTLVEEFSTEVAWHCLVEHPAQTNAYLIYDVLVFPQIVTGATANGTDGEYEMWLATLPDEQFNSCRCHMHSHVNMGVTPSGVDEGYYANLMTQVTDYYITMIINKKSDYHLRFYDKVNNILYEDKKLITCFENGTTLQQWYDSVKDVVKEKTYTPLSTPQQLELKEYFTKRDEENKRKPGRPKKKEDEDDTVDRNKYVRIQGPDNTIHAFTSLDTAVNFIYNEYPKENSLFSKNLMRHHLARDGMIFYDPIKFNFVYDLLDIPSGMEYGILRCDVWEVMR